MLFVRFTHFSSGRNYDRNWGERKKKKVLNYTRSPAIAHADHRSMSFRTSTLSRTVIRPNGVIDLCGEKTRYYNDVASYPVK